MLFSRTISSLSHFPLIISQLSSETLSALACVCWQYNVLHFGISPLWCLHDVEVSKHKFGRFCRVICYFIEPSLHFALYVLCQCLVQYRVKSPIRPNWLSTERTFLVVVCDCIVSFPSGKKKVGRWKITEIERRRIKVAKSTTFHIWCYVRDPFRSFISPQHWILFLSKM